MWERGLSHFSFSWCELAYAAPWNSYIYLAQVTVVLKSIWNFEVTHLIAERGIREGGGITWLAHWMGWIWQNDCFANLAIFPFLLLSLSLYSCQAASHWTRRLCLWGLVCLTWAAGLAWSGRVWSSCCALACKGAFTNAWLHRGHLVVSLRFFFSQSSQEIVHQGET